jgi:putative nucleotidyltransferase with HDIG domain
MGENKSFNSDEFSAVPLAKIPCGGELCVAVFVKIGDKFIKFKEKGDSIPEDKYNYFMSKNVTSLYVTVAEYQIFTDWLNQAREDQIAEVVAEVGEENKDIAVYEVFLDEDLSNETVEILQGQVKDFIVSIKEKPNETRADLFAKLSSMHNTIAEHSMNVANLSLFLGMTVGHSHQHVLENLYLGALFHDYGKAKIPTQILENPKSVSYAQAISDHPAKGYEMLKNSKEIPKQALTIVLEHHEQFAGAGFPKGLTGDQIYGLSKIVTIANVFDNICMEQRRTPKTMYKSAIKVLEYDKGKQFDPEIMPRILDALKLAFGNFERNRQPKNNNTPA